MRSLILRFSAWTLAGTLLTSCSGGGPSFGASTDANAKWVTAWGAATQAASAASIATGSANQTFRTIMKPSVGSRGTARLHLTNLYGTAPVTITALHLGLVSNGAAVQPGSDVAVTFAGAPSTTIAAGATVTTDAVPLKFAYGALVAATMYVAGSTASLPAHQGFGQIVDYATASGAGDETGDAAGSSFTPSTTTVLIDRLELYGDYIGTVAFAGSSTTAGYGVPSGSYEGFVDEFAADLHAAGRDDLALANMSIVPDSLLTANAPGTPSVQARLASDFLDLPGIRTIFQNTADVDLKSGPCDSAVDIIAGDRSLIAQAHAAGVRVALAVVAPSTYCHGQNPTGFGSRFPAGSGQDGQRDLLNEWITATAPIEIGGTTEPPSGADAVVDIATPVTDPTNTGYLLPVYDSGDDSHVNAAGQAVQAAAISVTSL